MKTLIATLAAVTALTAVAAPAAAQSYGRDRHDRYEQGRHGAAYNINARQERLDQRIDRGLRSGDLSRREAARLRAEFRAIARLEANYRINGLSFRERAELDRRFDRLEARIRLERRDRDYGHGYGRR